MFDDTYNLEKYLENRQNEWSKQILDILFYEISVLIFWGSKIFITFCMENVDFFTEILINCFKECFFRAFHDSINSSAENKKNTIKQSK